MTNMVRKMAKTLQIQVCTTLFLFPNKNVTLTRVQVGFSELWYKKLGLEQYRNQGEATLSALCYKEQMQRERIYVWAACYNLRAWVESLHNCEKSCLARPALVMVTQVMIGAWKITAACNEKNKKIEHTACITTIFCLRDAGTDHAV